MSSGGDSLRNPYYNLHALHDATIFFGRKQALTLLYETISNRQCLSFVGIRSIGKSSILECARLPTMQQQCGFDLSRHIFVFLDLRTYSQKTRADFFTSVNHQLRVQAHQKVALMATEGTEQDIFSTYLEQLKEQGFHAVVLMDAFDSVTRNKEFDWSFFGFLKAQVNQAEVSYVTASVKPLSEVCHPDIIGSPFFTIFTAHTLGPLTGDEACALVTNPSSRAGQRFTDDEVEWLLSLAGRHPMFLQQACRILFEEKRQWGNKEVNRKQASKQIYEQLFPYFTHTWETLEVEKRAQLEHEARRKLARNRAMPELSDSALFRFFVRSKAQVTLATLTLEDVKAAIEHLDDLRYLGDCPLSLLNVVLQRHQDATAPPSAIELGMAVRDILRAAFTRLRPQGGQKEAALEWRLYNILSYIYFTEQLPRVQLAARLGITKRHLQREQNRAIEALLDILLEMEKASRDDLGK